jgi:glucan 1,3-beta-glucosidase
MVLIRPSAPGAIVVEWNVRDPDGQQGAAAAWDTHVRLGAAAGTALTDAECLKQKDTGSECFAAFLGFHLTPTASAYLEGLWVWLGDHALDGGHQQITLYSGRGLLSESEGPVWLIGTGSEHHVLYQYSFVNAANHYGGLMQTETPYFQPLPAPPAPFVSNYTFNDPVFDSEVAAWALWVQESQGILIYGEDVSFLSKRKPYIYAFDQVPDSTLSSQTMSKRALKPPLVRTKSSTLTVALRSISTNYRPLVPANQLSVDHGPVIDQADNHFG